MHTPLFWKERNLLSTVLLPLSCLYGWLARRRQEAMHEHALSVRVICVGNIVAGGAGKTPVALALGKLLKEKSLHPYYLSRGYKGALSGPLQVDAAKHTAREVGDEPLLLAEVLPTWVAQDRAAGGKAAIAAGADMIVMDDGLQNFTLRKDVSFLVIDGAYGFGNERLLPAGPLREPIDQAMERVSAVILIGEDDHDVLSHVPPGIPVLRARIEPTAAALALKDKPVVAFAGIARPRKFYRTLQEVGCDIKKMVAYPDHHILSAKDAEFLRAKAEEFGGILVTTTKDYVRLPDSMRAEVTPLPINVVFEDNAALLKLILP